MNQPANATLYLSSKKAKRATSMLHMFAGTGLFFAGLNNLSIGDHATFAFLEMATGALLILAVLLEKILPHAHVERYDWVLDILAGCVAIVEGLSKMHGHFRAVVGTYIFAGLLFFALAYFRPRLKKMRFVRFEENSFTIKKHPFRRQTTIAWGDVASVEISSKIHIIGKSKTLCEIDLNDMEDSSGVRESFVAQAQQRGLFPHE